MSFRDYWRDLNRDHERSVSTSVDFTRSDQLQNLALATLCGLAALSLTVAVGYRAGFGAVHATGSHLPPTLLQIMSTFGESLPAICLLALFAKRSPKVVWAGFLSGMYATIITHALKHLCNTVRPAGVLGDWIVVTGPILRMHGLPSGHTVTAFLIAACLSGGASRPTKLALYAFACLVGLSRVWIGVHWPVDVLVGAAIAGLSTALAFRTMKLATRGLALAPHLLIVVLIAACAVWDLVQAPALPLARLLSVALAALALSVLARDYVILPLMAPRPGRLPPAEPLVP